MCSGGRPASTQGLFSSNIRNIRDLVSLIRCLLTLISRFNSLFHTKLQRHVGQHLSTLRSHANIKRILLSKDSFKGKGHTIKRIRTKRRLFSVRIRRHTLHNAISFKRNINHNINNHVRRTTRHLRIQAMVRRMFNNLP